MRDSCQEILRFWFEETAPALWYQENPGFDETVKNRFSLAYDMALDGLCASWADNAEGALALCIVFDQFPRMMFRNTAQAYQTDKKALLVAKGAISRGYDQIHPPLRRRFFYLPFLHSESLTDQDRSVTLFETIREEDPAGYEQALRARETIQKFGRFPQRNKLFSFDSTPEEQAWLAQVRQSS